MEEIQGPIKDPGIKNLCFRYSLLRSPKSDTDSFKRGVNSVLLVDTVLCKCLTTEGRTGIASLWKKLKVPTWLELDD